MSADRLRRGLRATFIGLAVNGVLAGVKLTTGLLGNSHALVADGVESLADLFSSIVVWRGLVVAAEPADEDHPYGHGKAEPLAAAIVSSLLLLAAIWVAAEAIQGFLRPHGPPAAFTLAVLAVAVFVKETLFRFVRGESVDLESSAMHADAWHHRSDALTSLAAALGISVSLLGGPGFAVADDVAAVIAASIIAWNGSRLLRPALHELMDRAPGPDVTERIRRLAQSVPGVYAVEKCMVRKMGNQYYVDMHAQVDPQMTVERSHEIAHEAKDTIRQQIPQVRDVLVHIEPAHQKTLRPRGPAIGSASEHERRQQGPE